MKLKIRHFKKVVTTAGTRERLTDLDLRVPMVTIQAEVSNTGQMYIGDERVSATSCGIELDSGNTLSIDSSRMGIADAKIALRDIWLDTSVSTDGVWVLYAERDD